jgi:hypothetical protein
VALSSSSAMSLGLGAEGSIEMPLMVIVFIGCCGVE